MDLERLTCQVQRNCDISDAHHAGIYSVCGLAMRLRDLYKWDRRLPPWEEHGADQVLDWIGAREDLWEGLTQEDYQPLMVDHNAFDPFDTAGINAVLLPHNLYYGAGYAHSLKPTFFLAEIDRQQTLGGHTVWHLGRELARDLLTLPAFSQDDQVVLRGEAARMYLWDQMAYIQSAGRPALAFALAACCNLSDTDLKGVRNHLATISDVLQSIYVRHELSELDDKVFERDTWRQMLADFPHSATELLARTLKDLLADTHPDGPLHDLIHRRDKAGIGFYAAFSGGLVPLLFGDLRAGFHRFFKGQDWQDLTDTVAATRQQVVDYTREILAIYSDVDPSQDLPGVQKAIEETLYQRGVPRPGAD